MPGKNKSAWKGLLTGLLVTAVVNFAGILLTTLLVMRGTLGGGTDIPASCGGSIVFGFLRRSCCGTGDARLWRGLPERGRVLPAADHDLLEYMG